MKFAVLFVALFVVLQVSGRVVHKKDDLGLPQIVDELKEKIDGLPKGLVKGVVNKNVDGRPSVEVKSIEKDDEKKENRGLHLGKLHNRGIKKHPELNPGKGHEKSQEKKSYEKKSEEKKSEEKKSKEKKSEEKKSHEKHRGVRIGHILKKPFELVKLPVEPKKLA